MNNNIAMVNRLLDAIEQNDLSLAQSFLTGDFMYIGAVPMPLTGLEWLDFQMKLLRAFPDWSYERAKFIEKDNKVYTSFTIKGTHNGILDLTDFGVEILPPTGKRFQLVTQNATFGLVDGKIHSFVTEHGMNGGLMGILNQIGFDLSTKEVA